MNYCALRNCDIANGTGMRVTLFVSGCTNHCPGCFQPQTWDFDYGQPFTEETEEHILKLLELKAPLSVTTGFDHIVAVDDKGTVYCWGNARLGQTKLPQELSENNRFHNFKITKVFASHQFSAALTDDNRLLLWGNANFADIGMDKELYDGHVVDAAEKTL